MSEIHKNKDTTDNSIIKLKLITFIAVLIATASASSTISGIIVSMQNTSSDILHVDNRVTKITTRNKEELNEVKKELKEVYKELRELNIIIVKSILKNGKETN